VIIIFYGTSGELIKIAPLIKGLPKGSYLTMNTAQQPGQVRAICKEANLAEADIVLANGHKGHELSKIWHMAVWFPVVVFNLLRNNLHVRKTLKSSDTKPIVLVHGDTVTTVIGAIYGRLNGYQVAHIEAGLRSHDWRNPFPEEIDRMIVSKIARLHYAPGDIPAENLRNAHTKGEIVNTKLNTVLDSMLMARQSPVDLKELSLPKEYGLVSIHRNELMAQPEVLKQLIITLNEYADKTPLIFLDHPVTKARIAELGYEELFTNSSLIRIPKQSYYRFMSLLANAQFVVTDSGGLQEESAYINMPCLLHRLATEREEGLGYNVVLSKFDDSIVRDFLDEPSKHQGSIADKKASPTGLIIASLRKLNYLK
jgi:UDP-N-acetylglucosamine 2-epimerase (non-hydrolysing)